jgi:hypothetical protein
MLIVHLYFNIHVVIHFEMDKQQRMNVILIFRLFFFILIFNRIIPVTEAGSNDPQYRLTESLRSYLNCRVRSRNKNLFTANQVRK